MHPFVSPPASKRRVVLLALFACALATPTVARADAPDQAAITALKAQTPVCRSGMKLLTDNMYVYPAVPKTPSGGKRAWTDAYGAEFKSKNLSACDAVGAFLAKYKGDSSLAPVETILQSDGGWSEYFTGKFGIVFQGDRIQSYCPNLHLSQFDCVKGTERVKWGITEVTKILDLLDKLTPAPTHMVLGRWTFEKGSETTDTTGNWGPLVLGGNAKIENGALSVDGPKSWARAAPVPGKSPAIAEKTLIAKVTLGAADSGGGSVLTVSALGMDKFDAVVYGERVPGNWMPGSTQYQRTQDLRQDPAKLNQPITVATVYKNVNGKAQVTLCIDGKQVGQYTQGPFATWDSGTAEILFGARHGTAAAPVGYLNKVRIDEAALWGNAVSCDAAKL